MSEHDHQVTVMQWAALQERKYPELALLYAIPNGGARNVIVAAKLKKEGVKSGVPDLCLPVARGGFHGFYAELKSVGRKPTPNQVRWMQALAREGYCVKLCYSASEAIAALELYLAASAVQKAIGFDQIL